MTSCLNFLTTRTMTCSAFIHCFLQPGLLSGFSKSLADTGVRWNRPQRDKTVILRLEQCFPECRQHTTAGPEMPYGCSEIRKAFKEWEYAPFPTLTSSVLQHSRKGSVCAAGSIFSILGQLLLIKPGRTLDSELSPNEAVRMLLFY
jgi:hypothetical protein